MAQLTIEQQFFTCHPEYVGAVITPFKRNQWTGYSQAVAYDVNLKRIAIVQQEGYSNFSVYPTVD